MNPTTHTVVKPKAKLDLSKIPTDFSGTFKDKDQGLEAAKKNLEKLDQLQEVLYAEGKRSLLVVLQAMDAGGKDGTIEFVFSGVNPQGCIVHSFKAPTSNELAQDYLWRVHHRCPPRGMIGIFNRSHYEDVLVPVVRQWIDPARTKQRFEHINAFEKMLSDEGTTIVKLFLHISKDEQRERLIARQQDPKKWWKFNPSDLDSRRDWEKYMGAYTQLLSATSTGHAPWHIIPADRKWYRNWLVSDILVQTLKSMNPKHPKSEVDPRTFKIE
jgi:PPK2 family polyphosphate:nucleotide phosphotransferase